MSATTAFLILAVVWVVDIAITSRRERLLRTRLRLERDRNRVLAETNRLLTESRYRQAHR